MDLWDRFYPFERLEMCGMMNPFRQIGRGHLKKHLQLSIQDRSLQSPVAQKAKMGFKLLLLERLNEIMKQKHFWNPCKKS